MTVGVEDMFKRFAAARDFHDIQDLFQEMCDLLEVDRADFRRVYRNIKSKVQTPQAKPLWALLDKRAKQSVYEKNKACSGAKMLVIGAGPCGLRMAIEGALLGARVVVVEARDYFARNNVLHLWPFVIHDLKSIGSKIFYPGFAVGSINHISIRRLQSILLKIALLLGVQVHTPVTYNGLKEPEADEDGTVRGWRVQLSPEVPSLAELNIDIIVGADGKRNALSGFHRKLFRGKQAIAITANFVNLRTHADNQVEEIGGIFYIFRREFFDSLKDQTGIELENFVYYRNDTHYFVMTAHKRSLLQKGVIREDSTETGHLLRRENIDLQRLRDYAMEAATVATGGRIPMMQFAQNQHAEDDVAIFDFTQMTQATHASLCMERENKRLLKCIVGDSLIEPFWPTGSGAARGFLSVYDAAWMMRSWCPGQRAPLDVLGEREALLKTLSQATPATLKNKLDAYTIDPTTRYGYVPPTLKPEAVRHLWDTSDIIEDHEPPPTPIRRFTEAEALIARRRRGRSNSVDGLVLAWYQERLAPYKDMVTVFDMLTSWRSGRALCALAHLYRPEELDMGEVDRSDSVTNVGRAFEVIEQEWDISPLMSPEDLALSDHPDALSLLTYLTQLKDALITETIPGASPCSGPMEFTADIQNHGMSSLDVAPRLNRCRRPSAVSLLTGMSEMIGGRKRPAKPTCTSTEGAEVVTESDMRDACTGLAAKRISAWQDKFKYEEFAKNKQIPAIGRARTWSTEKEETEMDVDKISNNGTSSYSTDRHVSSCKGTTNNGLDLQSSPEGRSRMKELTSVFDRPTIIQTSPATMKTTKPAGYPTLKPPPWGSASAQSSDVCCICGKLTYIMERHSTNGFFFHRHCSRCKTCKCTLRVGSMYINEDSNGVKFFCIQHAYESGHFKPSKRRLSMAIPIKNAKTEVKDAWWRTSNNTDQSGVHSSKDNGYSNVYQHKYKQHAEQDENTSIDLKVGKPNGGHRVSFKDITQDIHMHHDATSKALSPHIDNTTRPVQPSGHHVTYKDVTLQIKEVLPKKRFTGDVNEREADLPIFPNISIDDTDEHHDVLDSGVAADRVDGNSKLWDIPSQSEKEQSPSEPHSIRASGFILRLKDDTSSDGGSVSSDDSSLAENYHLPQKALPCFDQSSLQFGDITTNVSGNQQSENHFQHTPPFITISDVDVDQPNMERVAAALGDVSMNCSNGSADMQINVSHNRGGVEELKDEEAYQGDNDSPGMASPASQSPGSSEVETEEDEDEDEDGDEDEEEDESCDHAERFPMIDQDVELPACSYDREVSDITGDITGGADSMPISETIPKEDLHRDLHNIVVLRRKSKSADTTKRLCSTTYRQSASIRLLMAYEIQTGLEDVDQEEEALEERGRHVEEVLRGYGEEEDTDQEELLEEWMEVLQLKRDLRNKELRLLLKKKLLDLQEQKKQLNITLPDAEDPEAVQEEINQIVHDISEVRSELAELTTHIRQSQMGMRMPDFREARGASTV